MHTIEELRQIIAKIRQSVTTVPGDTAPGLRDAAEIRAARHAGGRRQDPQDPAIPPDLDRFLQLVSSRAFEISDEDVEQLKAAGYSEDAIFELTVCGAVGEGLARLERTLDLLEGGP